MAELVSTHREATDDIEVDAPLGELLGDDLTREFEIDAIGQCPLSVDEVTTEFSGRQLDRFREIS